MFRLTRRGSGNKNRLGLHWRGCLREFFLRAVYLIRNVDKISEWKGYTVLLQPKIILTLRDSLKRAFVIQEQEQVT